MKFDKKMSFFEQKRFIVHEKYILKKFLKSLKLAILSLKKNSVWKNRYNFLKQCTFGLSGAK